MAPGVEVVADDLKPEKLTLEGLELGEATSSIVDQGRRLANAPHRYRVTAVGHHAAEADRQPRRPVPAARDDGDAPTAARPQRS